MIRERVQALLDAYETDEAISLLDGYRASGAPMDDTLFYLLGNAWRKKGNWQMAINNYLEALHLNPDSPAKQALDIANEILDFYNKDMYNQ
ncbi:MAG: tetratricopeptide repeat protein [Bacteroidales bacterium]|jgi:tetratricopeptide (TPR) repeat protein|nr:tetratricopeptide repeat protein [Bacteroidales bacterium]MBR6864349.1 tetratricopeptide repeat protein [Bacteroidales bacterium]